MANKDKKVETVLCIPGRWKDREDLLKRIVANSQGYVFAGRVFIHVKTKAAFTLIVEESDDRMADGFRAAGTRWMTAADRAEIEAHSFVLYLIAKGGSPSRIESIMAASRGLLRSGGSGVKVESSGIAHRADTWLDFAEEGNQLGAHDAFVVNVMGDQAYSRGMHNLGFRDAIVKTSDCEHPAELLRAFTQHLVSDNPVVRDGETFFLESGASGFRLSSEPCELDERNELCTNPFGMWRLNPI